jgi:hypothetical protein
MQPIDGASCRVFCHSFDPIVVRPTVVTVEVAGVFREKVGDNGPQLVSEVE